MAFEHLIDRYWLTLTCRGCGHAARLDPAALAQRYRGRRLTTHEFARRSKCARCGQKWPTATLEPMRAPSLVLPAWDAKSYWRSLRHFHAA